MQVQMNIGGESNHIAISRDDSRLIIEELEPDESRFSVLISALFSLTFVAFGLFITISNLDTASEPLRYPAAALFCALGLGIFWIAINRRKYLRMVKADQQTRTIEYGENLLGKDEKWRYVKKGVFPYHTDDQLYLGQVNKSRTIAKAAYTGLHSNAKDGPRNGLLVMGAAYELEMAIEQICEHMAALPEPAFNSIMPERRRFGRRMRKG